MSARQRPTWVEWLRGVAVITVALAGAVVLLAACAPPTDPPAWPCPGCIVHLEESP